MDHPRLTKVIAREFRVGWLLHELGWSVQKPERRALERNEERVERWKRESWPQIKTSARLGEHLVSADESG